MTTTEKPAADNGVDVPFLLGARTALTDEPAGAQFQWRAETEWVKGTHSRGTVKTFFGLGEEQEHSSSFTFDADHPLQFSSEDHGATPVEILLVALGACLTGGVASVAQLREIQLRSVKATITGEHDILGILGAARHWNWAPAGSSGSAVRAPSRTGTSTPLSAAGFSGVVM